MSAIGLEIEHTGTASSATWTLRGELDLATLGCVETVLTSELASSNGNIVLDVHELDFIGFDGLGLLVRLAHRHALADRCIVLSHPTDLLRRVADIAGIELLPMATEAVVVPPQSTARVPGSVGRPPRPRIVHPSGRRGPPG